MTERAGTATVVFTDLVGSTALRARLGEEQADALQGIHDDLLTARVEANAGQVLKRMGDGMVAVFPAASDAVTAAVQIQQAVARYNHRPGALAELSIRMGLSTGDVSWRDGDCFGTPMVEAARLEAAAAGGQILCSDFVRMMARGRGGHDFSALGFLELKGLPEPLATCEVLWAPVPSAPFPLPPELAGGGGHRRPFVARTGELERAEQLLTDPGRERVAVLWLLGEPGIGKTRLATELAVRAHETGTVVLFGRCNEDLSVPYQPFLEALRFFLGHLPDDQLSEGLGTSPGELTRLVPELSARLAGLAPTASTSAEIEQHRLFDAVRSWLAGASEERPVVLLLDDVHWAPRPTLALLGHVARSAAPSRVLLVCTARNTSPDDNEALADLAEELERRGTPSLRLELAGLDADDVGELVASAAGRPLDGRLRTLAAQLTEETAGNPLFVDALLASLPADPAWHPGVLPRSVAETVRRRVGRLSPEVADLLRVASVVGLDFDLRVTARAGGRGELAALEAFETAARAGLVVEAGTDRYRFTHALVRSALGEELSRSRRVRVHLAIAEALEALYGNKIEEQVAALAHHFFEAVPVAGADPAYRYAVLAAERAVRLLAHDEAAADYGRALELLDDVGVAEPLARYQLLLAMGNAQRKAGDFRAAFTTLRAAADEAAARGGPELEAQAAVAFEEASWRPGSLGADSLALLQRAEAVLPDGDSALRALTLAGLSRALEFSGRRSEGIAQGDEALAMARRLDDRATLAKVLYATSFAYFDVADTPVLRVRSREFLALTATLEDDEIRVQTADVFLATCEKLGDFATFDEVFPAYARGLDESRQPFHRWLVSRFRYLRAFVAGGLEEAERRLEEAHAAQAMELDDGIYSVGMFLLRREQGRLHEVAPALRLLVRLDPQAGRWQPGLAALYAEMGMLDEARAAFEGLAAHRFAAIPTDQARMLSLGLLAEVCCTLGDADRAAWLAEEIRPCRGMILTFTGTCVCLGPVDRLLGMLAVTMGRPSEATMFFDSALDLSRRTGSPVFTAHCLADYAAFNAPEDAGRARAMGAEAAELCERHGLAGLGTRLRAYLYPTDHPANER